jgi:outer membrane receptor for ferrienterochelin and colicin
VWLNSSTYKIYPNLYFQKQLKDTNYLVKSGWNTNFINNHYGNIAISNPWIAPILDMKATTLEKKFIDLEISSSKRLNYTLGLALNDYRNLVLFNRIIEPEIFKHGLKYQALFEPRAITLEVNASMRYQFSERILIHNSFKYLQFNSIKENAKPWGVLPLEIKSNLTWVPNRKWSIDAGMHYWTGSTQLDQNNKVTNLKNTLVLQAGFNYKLSTNWTAWAKGDNLLDKPYERWGNYPSLGVQIIAGIIYSFK